MNGGYSLRQGMRQSFSGWVHSHLSSTKIILHRPQF